MTDSSPDRVKLYHDQNYLGKPKDLSYRLVFYNCFDAYTCNTVAILVDTVKR